ncbi:MAG: DUF3459 domain-containing protein, partial [Isosphaeraceae bacterium]
LPMPAGWDRFAVDSQAASASSMLAHYRRALGIRRRLAGRLTEEVEWCSAPEAVLAYTRGTLAVACNFSSRRAEMEIGGRLLMASDPRAGKRAGKLNLPPNSAAWLGLRA